MKTVQLTNSVSRTLSKSDCTTDKPQTHYQQTDKTKNLDIQFHTFHTTTDITQERRKGNCAQARQLVARPLAQNALRPLTRHKARQQLRPGLIKADVTGIFIGRGERTPGRPVTSHNRQRPTVSQTLINAPRYLFSTVN